MPAFGPCFINFYGAPREFETIAVGDNNLDHLNMGKGVGCAYRGRALIEIETKLGETTEEGDPETKATQLVPTDDITKLQPFLRLIGKNHHAPLSFLES